MKLYDELMKEHSKNQCNNIVGWVGKDKKRFRELFRLFIGADKLISQRAGWPLAYIVIDNPFLIEPFFKQFIDNLHRSELHGAVKRNSMKILENIDLPEEFHGEIMNLCFQYLEDPKEEVAVKALSLTVLGRLAKIYSEIIPEVKIIIDESQFEKSAAMRSRIRKFEQQLK